VTMDQNRTATATSFICQSKRKFYLLENNPKKPWGKKIPELWQEPHTHDDSRKADRCAQMRHRERVPFHSLALKAAEHTHTNSLSFLSFSQDFE
jgi:hypothetical protein